jgi:DnaJ-class molecular chaperone
MPRPDPTYVKAEPTGVVHKCRFCNGTGKEHRTSFVDPEKTIERTCRDCCGAGSLAEVLVTRIERWPSTEKIE